MTFMMSGIIALMLCSLGKIIVISSAIESMICLVTGSWSYDVVRYSFHLVKWT